jgi:calreticulin
LDCGGGYIKLFPSSSDMKSMGGDTPYSIMFGPDICGHATKRVHVILANKHNRLPANLMIKDAIECKTDTLTHVYTLILSPNNTYVVKIDDEAVSTGSVEEMWDFLPPKDIKDPAATKPEDWDDRPHVPDEDDVKPDGYDDVPGEFIFGYFWLFLVIFGYFWLFLVIFGYFLVIFGNSHMGNWTDGVFCLQSRSWTPTR